MAERGHELGPGVPRLEGEVHGRGDRHEHRGRVYHGSRFDPEHRTDVSYASGQRGLADPSGSDHSDPALAQQRLLDALELVRSADEA